MSEQEEFIKQTEATKKLHDEIVKIVKEEGFKIVYWDTDSFYVIKPKEKGDKK